MKLNKLIENEDNPSFGSEEDIERLAGKLKRVPEGLKAMRIAYVTDKGDKFVVLSGNKRLRVLKKLYGEDAEIDDDYFQDVTSMSEEERREFIIDSNISDGQWITEILVRDYELQELNTLMDTNTLTQLFGDKILEQEKEENTCSRKELKEEVETTTYESKVGHVYELGSSSIYCGNESDCDMIRQYFSEQKYGISSDWRHTTKCIDFD